jgi:hypothetical protein
MAGVDTTTEWCGDTGIDGTFAPLWLSETSRMKLSGCLLTEKREEMPSICSWIGKEL